MRVTLSRRAAEAESANLSGGSSATSTSRSARRRSASKSKTPALKGRNGLPQAAAKNGSLAGGQAGIAQAGIAQAGIAGSQAETIGPLLGTAADHPAVHQFLMAVFRGPSREEFLSSLEDPFYEPHDRILVKRGHQVASHLLLNRRVMHLGRLRLPIFDVAWLATLQELRGQGYASKLLRKVRAVMAEDGTPLAFLRTRAPHFVRDAGFVLCGRHSHSRANARDLLTQLPPHDPNAAISIRPWRQVELPGLMQMYESCVQNAAGAVERTEAYWRWLISRKRFDQIFVAAPGGGKIDLDDAGASLLGYAVVRDEQVLELMVPSANPQVGRRLLARACREAIERDLHAVELHGPPDEPLHKVFAEVGGVNVFDEAHQGEVFMVSMPDPVGFLKQICPELHRRGTECGLVRPCELGLLVDGAKHRLVISRRSVKLAADKTGRSYLSLTGPQFVRMVLGHLDVAEAVETGRIEASTRVAVQIAAALFPKLPLWRPRMDDPLG